MAGSQKSNSEICREVTLWVHPGGRVWGSVMAAEGSADGGGDLLLDVLNEELAFLAIRLDRGGVRLYNRAAIVRVQYRRETPRPVEDGRPLRCRLMLMDGSVIEGTVMNSLPRDRARLFDFLNLDDERFAKLYLDDGDECLINKTFILSVTPMREHDPGRSV